MSPTFYFRAIFGDASTFLWLNGTVNLTAGHAGQPSPAGDPTTFPVAQRVHVAETFDAATRKYTLYKNGAYVASGVAGTSPDGGVGTNL